MVTAIVYDIAICPTCNGNADVIDGQMMYNNNIYPIRKPCPNPKCHDGRMGIPRIEEVGNESIPIDS